MYNFISKNEAKTLLNITDAAFKYIVKCKLLPQLIITDNEIMIKRYCLLDVENVMFAFNCNKIDMEKILG